VIADGLKPLSISHMARIISLDMIGRYNSIEGVMIFVISNRFTNISNMDPKNPQIDNQLGISFDLNKRK
jgi:hypothetical protein